jgi:hypothetical protein
VFWSYLVIVYAFNDALCEWNHPLVRKRARDSVFLNNQAGFTARA